MIENCKIILDIYSKIPAGYIGHKYLCPDVAYRLILSYSKGDGFICIHYDTPEEAWQDPRIQSRIVEAGVCIDYDTYLKTVDRGERWTLLGMTVLRCRITMHGNIQPVSN